MERKIVQIYICGSFRNKTTFNKVTQDGNLWTGNKP